MKATHSQHPLMPGRIAEQAINAKSSADATEALRRGPRGAIILAAIAVAMLFVGWMLFYFVLFMRRGYVG